MGSWSDLNRVRRSRRVALQGTALTAGAGVFLAACGGRGNSGSKPSASAGANDKPRQGGQFTAAQGNDPYNYDPSIEPQSNGFIVALAGDGLLDAQTGSGVAYTDVAVQSGLADRWESPDAQTYTFHLHPGAQFANLPPVNGRQVTSTDVKLSYEYLSRSGQFKDTKLPPSINAVYFTGLERIETPDPLTVVVHLQAPFSPFLNYMAMREFNIILAHEIYDQDGTFSKRTIGSGPWQLDASASQQGQRWVMRRNPTYFKKGQPYLDSVQYLVLTDTASEVAAFQTKQIDMLPATAITVQSVPQLKRNNPNAIVETFLDNAGGHLFMNARKPPLGDLRIRKAIALSIDRDAFLKAFSDGQGEWATAGGYRGLFSQQELRQMLPYDPAQAKQLLSAAGYPNGIEFELLYPAAAAREHWLNVDQLIQAQLKQIGISATLKGVDVANFNFRMRGGDYQLSWETEAVQGDPDKYIYLVFYSKALGNYGGINDPELDKLLVAQRQELDAGKRKETLRQAARRIIDQAWSVGFYYGQAYTFLQPYVRNLTESALFAFAPVYETWVEK